MPPPSPPDLKYHHQTATFNCTSTNFICHLHFITNTIMFYYSHPYHHHVSHYITTTTSITTTSLITVTGFCNSLPFSVLHFDFIPQTFFILTFPFNFGDCQWSGFILGRFALQEFCKLEELLEIGLTIYFFHQRCTTRKFPISSTVLVKVELVTPLVLQLY